MLTTEGIFMKNYLELNGHTYTVRHESDPDSSPLDDDGHGPVSDWTRRAKMPGELILCEDRGSFRYYDYSEAVKIARRDVWDTAPYGQGTKGERAARAARADYNYLRQWFTDCCHYIGVIVEDEETGDQESLWGVEDLNDYPDEVAHELAAELDRVHLRHVFPVSEVGI